MKAGEVVTIRLEPEDVITCLDICEQAGFALYGASLSQVVKLALANLCEGARSVGLAPAAGHTDYLARLAKYKAHKQDKKLAISRKMDAESLTLRQADMTRTPGVKFPAPIAPTQLAKDSPEYKRKQVRFTELAFKKRNNLLNMSEQEVAEFDLLFDEGVRP